MLFRPGSGDLRPHFPSLFPFFALLSSSDSQFSGSRCAHRPVCLTACPGTKTAPTPRARSAQIRRRRHRRRLWLPLGTADCQPSSFQSRLFLLPGSAPTPGPHPTTSSPAATPTPHPQPLQSTGALLGHRGWLCESETASGPDGKAGVRGIPDREVESSQKETTPKVRTERQIDRTRLSPGKTQRSRIQIKDHPSTPTLRIKVLLVKTIRF